MPFVGACLSGRSQCVPENMALAFSLQLLRWKWVFTLGGIFLPLLGMLGLWSTQVSTPCSLLWLKPHWQRLGRRLGIGTILPLAWTSWVVAGKKDRLSSLRMLVNTQSSIQRTFQGAKEGQALIRCSWDQPIQCSYLTIQALYLFDGLWRG